MNNSFLNNQIGYDAMAKISKFPLQSSGFKPLFKRFCIGSLIFFSGLGTSYAQLEIPICDPGIGILDGNNDSVDINGVTITGAKSGSDVSLRNTEWVSCATETPGGVSVGSGNLLVGSVNGGGYDHTYTFSAPINNAVIVLNATGPGSNENFVITTSHSVAPEIEMIRGCHTAITANSISSGGGAPTGAGARGGGGYFRIKSESPYTSLKIAGTGAVGGSIYSLCRSSIIRTNITPFRVTKTASPDPAVAGHTLTYTTTLEELTGSAATNVVATDTLDSGITNVSVVCSDSGSADITTLPDVSCTWAAVAANSTMTMTVMGDAPMPGS